MYGAPYNGAPQQYGAAPAMPGYYGGASPAPSMYGQPAAPAPQQQPYYSHGPPSLAAPSAAAPSPPPHLASPDAFAAYYHSQLATLTFNSKPIINNLTIIAHEHVAAMGNVVAQCVDEHISQTLPAYRLPALYLLDSISKNIGEPYTSLWSDRIAALFLETYRVVEQGVKVRMEELLGTWREAGPGRRPLFGEQAQWNIERSLFGSQGVGAPLPAARAVAAAQGISPHHVASPNGYLSPAHGWGGNSPLAPSGGRSPQPGMHAAPPAAPAGNAALEAEKARAIEQINRLLSLGTQDQYRNPAAYSATRMSALRQLRDVLQTTPLSPAEVAQIVAQLAALGGEMSAAGTRGATPPTGPRADRIAAQQQQQAAAVPAIPANLSQTLANLGKLGPLHTPPTTHAAAAPAPNAASDLIKSLMQAGLLPNPAGAAAPAKAEQDADYAAAILALDIKFTSSELQREPPVGALELMLHKHLPQQCRQCANRYPPGARGQRSMDEHLDWHFRQNRRAKDSAARGQSRSWFGKLAHWIRGGFDDAPPAQREGAERPGALTPAQEAELKAAAASFVVAPTDDPDAAARPCPICKELFKSEWSEDEEEWIWRDAVRVDGTYYHGTCRYSAKALSSAVTRSGTPPDGASETESQSGSRAGTPQLAGGAAHAANPVVRIKEEALGSAATQKKRKDSPAALEAAAGDGAVDEAPAAKRLAPTDAAAA